MATLVSILLAVDVALLLQRRSGLRPLRIRLFQALVGISAVGVGFFLTTPYFFLDFSQALANLQHEARTAQLGYDGLSPVGNFLQYLTVVIPRVISWPQMVLFVIGASLVVWKGRFKRRLLLGFILVFISTISLSSLHWTRWTIQILPLCASFVAYGLDRVIDFLTTRATTRIKATHHSKRLLIVLGVMIISAWPVYRLTFWLLQQSNPSTRIVARYWVIENLPSRSRIIQEMYTAPLVGTDFVYEQVWQAALRPLDDYIRDGYDYIIINKRYYELYLAEPERYQSEIDFYRDVFDSAQLVREFYPSMIRSGDVIQIYELPKPEGLE